MAEKEAICYQVRLKNRRVRITTNGEMFVIRWKRLMSDRKIKIREAILSREAAEATMRLLLGLLEETEAKQ